MELDYVAEYHLLAVQWAYQTLQKEFVILDTETTDLPKNGGEVIQLGIIDPEGKTLFNGLIKPCGTISLAAQRIHHITNEHVKDAPNFKGVFIEVKKAVGDRLIIAYNSDFDRQIMANSCRKADVDLLLNEWDDAMIPASWFRGEWDDYHDNFRWPKLVDMMEFLSLPIESAHDATGDARMTLALIRRMAREHLSFS